MDNINYIEILQEESRKCLKEFIQACEENKLNYYLFFGSLLGAVRHKGFIPWDDDIDIVMPRKDYDKFITLFGEHFSDDYFLDGFNCSRYLNNQPNCRIDFKHILIRKDKDRGVHYYNAFISLFPIDGIPNNVIMRRIHIYRLKFYYGLLRLSRSYRVGIDKLNKRTVKDKFFIVVSKCLPIGGLLSPQVIVKKYNQVSSKYDYIKKNKCIVSWNFIELESHLMVEGVPAVFDDIHCMIPSGWDALLTKFYGDYMILPSEDKRIPHHGYELIRE